MARVASIMAINTTEDIPAKIKDIEVKIEKIEKDIDDVVNKLAACDGSDIEYLRKKEQQLRDKEGLLRKKEEQLREFLLITLQVFLLFLKINFS